VRRRLTLLLAGAVCAAVVSPVLRAPEHDSFPLSTYPMFAFARSRVEPVSTAVAIDRAGHEHFLTPELVARTDEPVQAVATVDRAVSGGTADRLCREIARRVARARPGTATIEIVTAEWDSVRFFEGDRRPRARTVHARCPAR
jgi:hypothetical protein